MQSWRLGLLLPTLLLCEMFFQSIQDCAQSVYGETGQNAPGEVQELEQPVKLQGAAGSTVRA